MVYAQRRSKRSKRKSSEFGNNKSNFKLYEDESNLQTTASSFYKKDKKRANRFKVDHELENWIDTEKRKK